MMNIEVKSIVTSAFGEESGRGNYEIDLFVMAFTDTCISLFYLFFYLWFGYLGV